MKRYLILYGEDNDMATFEAEDAAHAVEQFVSWAPVSPDDQDNLNSINEVLLCSPVAVAL